MSREKILDKILELYKQIQPLQKEINQLVEQAKQIEDAEDDENQKKYRFSILESIKSYQTYD